MSPLKSEKHEDWEDVSFQDYKARFASYDYEWNNHSVKKVKR